MPSKSPSGLTPRLVPPPFCSSHHSTRFKIFTSKKYTNILLLDMSLFFSSKNTLHVFVFQTMFSLSRPFKKKRRFVMGHTRQFICVASGSRFVAFSPVVSAPRSTLNRRDVVADLIPSTGIRTEHTLCMHAESGVLASPSSSFFYIIKKQQPLCLLGP